MATKTYYGKLDCFSNPGTTAADVANEYWTGFNNFMNYMSGSGVVSLVSWNSGSSVLSGSFQNRTYHDEALPWGHNAWTLWRWNTSSVRNWEWYLYAQLVYNTQTIQDDFTTPITGWGGTVVGGNRISDQGFNNAATSTQFNAQRGVLIQAALCISRSNEPVNFNPWNGTISGTLSDGGASAATGYHGATRPRWVSGSNNNVLFVLPRSNDVSGAHETLKSNTITLGSRLATGISFTGYNHTQMRYHFISDGDSLITLTSTGTVNRYSTTYVGAFDIRAAQTGSLAIGGINAKKGFIMYTNPNDENEVVNAITNINVFQTSSVLCATATGLSTNPNANDCMGLEGGVVISSLHVTGSKIMSYASVNNALGTTIQPSTFTNQYDEWPIKVLIKENNFGGYIGDIPPGMSKIIIGPDNHDVTSDTNRAVFGATSNVYDGKITTPWYGPNPPGVGLHRTGSLASWAIDYDPASA